MFGGIVETIGYIKSIQLNQGCKGFSIQPIIPFTDIAIGDSIAVNGICLTITKYDSNVFHVVAVPETLKLTNLNDLNIDDTVNLERSLKMNSRVGGHHVQGHVDGLGEILEIKSDQGQALLTKISIPAHLSKYLVNKGYIALDGMSITIIQANAQDFTVTFIPHTQEVTIVNQYKVGKKINIEVDMLGKYIEKLLGGFSHVNAN